MKRSKITTLHRVAKQRNAGFLEACMQSGRISQDGQWMEWTDEVHGALREQFNPLPNAFRPGLGLKQNMGIGDIFGKIATPVARKLGLPCVDKATGDLKPESKCAKRKAKWNKAGRKLSDLAGKAKTAILG
jgi:hypothetical protein